MEKENLARIHSFESFGTVDGPGIRFVIFMQGCPLRCKYCHNRDTWDINCGQLISKEELIEKIERYRNYIVPSGGGITISGGEPLLQTNFLISLFKELKQRHFHTAIDTSGMFNITEEIKELLSLTDLVLLDIKHINDDKCKELVGCSNKKELDFANYLSENGIPIWIRQVIIPGITDDENDLKLLGKFIHSLKTVEKVELLAYHNVGEFKWKSLGYIYPLENTRTATSEDISRAKKIIEET